MNKTEHSRFFAISTIALSIFSCALPAVTAVPAAPIIYGSLGNFDVINDTGQPCNGFEIELEGVSPGDIVYTFGDTGGANPTKYIRYGKPTILATSTGAIVRYASPFEANTKKFTETTPAAVPPYPVTMGHQCWFFGDPTHYPTSGCEHFGMALIRNPTKTTYRWLIGDTTTGNLKVVGSIGNPNIPAPVKVPPPIWNINQPPPPVPGVPPPPPQVVAVVQAPPAPPIPPGGVGQWGEAIWMKIYKTELTEAVDLEDLLLGERGVPNPEVEPPEIEWQLLQSPPVGKEGKFEASENVGEPGDDSESVSRRYEYYKYTGMYDQDPENFGEAFCDNPTEVEQQTEERCGTQVIEGVAGVGDLIGAQNVAANLVPLCAADVSSDIAIKRSGFAFNFTTRLYSQKVTLTNTSKNTIFGPIALALDNLTLTGANGLYNLSGKTNCTNPLNSPYIETTINATNTGLAPGASVSVLLKFSNAANTGIAYSTRVLSTAGSR